MERKRGIELLKIFAIFIIIISHVTQSLTSINSYMPYSEYVIDISSSNSGLTNILLLLLSYLGVFGNQIFFICSAWFLLGKDISYKKKVFYMITDVWTISILFFLPIIIARSGDVAPKLILASFLPTLMSNNWYITCIYYSA